MALILDIECIPDPNVLAEPTERAWVEEHAKKHDQTPEQYCQLCPPLAKVYCVGFTDQYGRLIDIRYDAGEYGLATEEAWKLLPSGRKSVNQGSIDVVATPSNNEKELLVSVAEVIESTGLPNLPLVTYNGRGYDFLVLWHRMKRAGITCSRIGAALRERRWDHSISDDLQDVATFDGAGGRFPLAAYALGHRLHFSKGDVNGADLLSVLQAGDVDKVLRYNAGDVECTRQLYRHLRG